MMLGLVVSGSRDGMRIGPDIDLGPLGHFKGGFNIDNKGQLKSVDVDVAVNIGVASVNIDTEIDSDGDVSGGVGGRVNMSGVEVGANVAVDKRGQVSGGGSVGVGLEPMGVVDLHVKGGPDGASIGVGARAGYGPASCNISVDINDRGVASADIRGGVDMGPGSVKGGIYVDTQGRVRGNARVSAGLPMFMNGDGFGLGEYSGNRLAVQGRVGASIGVQYDNENDDDNRWSPIFEPSISVAIRKQIPKKRVLAGGTTREQTGGPRTGRRLDRRSVRRERRRQLASLAKGFNYITK